MTAAPKTSRPPTARELVQTRKASDTLAKLKDGAPKAEPRSPSLPAKATPQTTAVAVPDGQPYTARYLDEIAPSGIVGRLIKFSKDGEFCTNDDGQAVPEGSEFYALLDETLIGWVKFGDAPGEPPTKIMGRLYDNFQMPARASLGDTDPERWPLGLDNEPDDVWKHYIYVVLQHTGTSEMFTFVTSSKTGRRACGNLLRHFDRIRRTHPGEVPVVRLGKGGFAHRDTRVGWVDVPVFIVVGKSPRDGLVKPDTSLGAQLDDELPFGSKDDEEKK